MRVSYTINNTQPVRCTIIGDEPLFYLTYEEALEIAALMMRESIRVVE